MSRVRHINVPECSVKEIDDHYRWNLFDMNSLYVIVHTNAHGGYTSRWVEACWLPWNRPRRKVKR